MPHAELLTLDVAHQLRLTPRRIRRMAQLGILPSRTVGNVRIFDAVIIEVLAARRAVRQRLRQAEGASR